MRIIETDNFGGDYPDVYKLIWYLSHENEN